MINFIARNSDNSTIYFQSEQNYQRNNYYFWLYTKTALWKQRKPMHKPFSYTGGKHHTIAPSPSHILSFPCLAKDEVAYPPAGISPWESINCKVACPLLDHTWEKQQHHVVGSIGCLWYKTCQYPFSTFPDYCPIIRLCFRNTSARERHHLRPSRKANHETPKKKTTTKNPKTAPTRKLP